MLNTVRSIRISQSTTLFPHHIIRRNTSGLSFKKPAAASVLNKEDMDQQPQQTNNRNTKTGDEMSHSFGEGYATRCDEEGFGGIYGGNDDPLNSEEKPPSKIIHESHPEYDKTQGSEVAEKEKARHQKTADS